jgi:hypothetical protein
MTMNNILLARLILTFWRSGKRTETRLRTVSDHFCGVYSVAPERFDDIHSLVCASIGEWEWQAR